MLWTNVASALAGLIRLSLALFSCISYKYNVHRQRLPLYGVKMKSNIPWQVSVLLKISLDLDLSYPGNITSLLRYTHLYD